MVFEKPRARGRRLARNLERWVHVNVEFGITRIRAVIRRTGEKEGYLSLGGHSFSTHQYLLAEDFLL